VTNNAGCQLGWTLRYYMQMVLNIFYCCIAHILRGLIMAHIIHTEPLWCSGVLFSYYDHNSFLGHILPRGQMSYGVQLLYKFGIDIPAAGNSLFYGYGVVLVCKSNIKRFFSYILFSHSYTRFCWLHIFLLHNAGSSTHWVYLIPR